MGTRVENVVRQVGAWQVDDDVLLGLAGIMPPTTRQRARVARTAVQVQAW